MGNGAGLFVAEAGAASSCSKFWDNHEGDGTEFPNNDTPSTADAGADAVNDRGSTSSNLGTCK